VLQTNFLQIAGAVSILKGLDYHRDQFILSAAELHEGVTSKRRQLLQEYLLHEAVAYVNRAGQFYYFAKSGIVKAKGTPPSIPRITELVNFRHKHTAHRSVDVPRLQDTEEQQAYHAMSLSEFGGQLWIPKEKDLLSTSFADLICGGGYLAFRINTDNNFYDLVIERDHEALMQEAYEILLHVLQ
jgi:hypothetical protein